MVAMRVSFTLLGTCTALALVGADEAPPKDSCKAAEMKYCEQHRDTPEACKACAGDHLDQLSAAGCEDADIQAFCAPPQPVPTNITKACQFTDAIFTMRNRSCHAGASWCPGGHGCMCTGKPSEGQGGGDSTAILNSINDTHFTVHSLGNTLGEPVFDDMVVTVTRGHVHAYDWCEDRRDPGIDPPNPNCRNDNLTADFTGGDGTATEYGADGRIGFGDDTEGGDGCAVIYWWPRAPHNGTFPNIYEPGPKYPCEHQG
eukprot:COSAG02_NODE_18474_length_936_cov_1.102748_1_plen_257_part_01